MHQRVRENLRYLMIGMSCTLFAGFVACKQRGDSSVKTDVHLPSEGLSTTGLALGDGWDSINQKIVTTHCLDGTTGEAVQTLENFSVEVESSAQNVVRNIGIDLSSDVGIVKNPILQSLGFAVSQNGNKQSQNGDVYVVVKYIHNYGGAQRLSDPKLKKDVTDAMAANGRVGLEKLRFFLETCGDRYVKSLKRTHFYYGVLKVSFANTTAASEFKSKLGVVVGPLKDLASIDTKLQANLKKDSDASMLQASLSIAHTLRPKTSQGAGTADANGKDASQCGSGGFGQKPSADSLRTAISCMVGEAMNFQSQIDPATANITEAASDTFEPLLLPYWDAKADGNWRDLYRVINRSAELRDQLQTAMDVVKFAIDDPLYPEAEAQASLTTQLNEFKTAMNRQNACLDRVTEQATWTEDALKPILSQCLADIKAEEQNNASTQAQLPQVVDGNLRVAHKWWPIWGNYAAYNKWYSNAKELCGNNGMNLPSRSDLSRFKEANMAAIRQEISVDDKTCVWVDDKSVAYLPFTDSYQNITGNYRKGDDAYRTPACYILCRQ